MKYILTLEKYQAYSDFKRNWGSPVEMREDAEFCLGRLLPKEDMIKSIDDQSTEKNLIPLSVDLSLIHISEPTRPY